MPTAYQATVSQPDSVPVFSASACLQLMQRTRIGQLEASTAQAHGKIPPLDKSGKLVPGFDASGGNLATTMLGWINEAFSSQVESAVKQGQLDRSTAAEVVGLFSSGKRMGDIRLFLRSKGYSITDDGRLL